MSELMVSGFHTPVGLSPLITRVCSNTRSGYTSWTSSTCVSKMLLRQGIVLSFRRALGLLTLYDIFVLSTAQHILREGHRLRRV